MGVMNQVMGGVGEGVQPKDSAMPTGPAPETGAPTLGSVLGTSRTPASMPAQGQSFGALMAQPQTAPAAPPPDAPKPQTKTYEDQKADDSQDADSILHKLRAVEKGQPEKENEDPVLAQLKAFESGGSQSNKFDPNNPVIDPRKPDEGMFDYVKRLGKEELQFLGASNRGNLGNKEQFKTAFESMYGKDNVQMRGDKLYFKPDGSRTFRPADQVQMGLITDFFARHAAQAPGLIAGGAAEMAAAGTGAAAPAIGGAMMGGTNYALQKATDAFSSQPQIGPGQDASALGGQLAEGATAMYGGKIAGAVLGPAARWGIDKLKSAFGAAEDAAQPIIGAVKDFAKIDPSEKAGKILQALDNTVSAIKNSMSGAGPSVGNNETDVGRTAYNAADSIRKNLGARIGLIKDKAVELADQQQVGVDPTNLLTELKNKLSPYGIKFDDAGFIVRSSGDGIDTLTGKASAIKNNPMAMNAFGDSRGSQELENLANLYDNVLALHTGSGGKGIPLQTAFNYMDGISQVGNYEKAGKTIVPDSIDRVYRDLRKAAGQDTYGTMDKLFTGSGLPEEGTWRDAYAQYSDKIDALNQVKGFFKDDASRSTIIEQLTNAGTTTKVRMLGAFKEVLGAGSETWNSVRGEVLNKQMAQFTDPATGVFNSKGFMQSFGTMNPAVKNILFSPGEYRTIMQVGREAYGISIADQTLSSSQKEVLVKGIKTAVEMAPGGKAPMFLFKLFNSNKAAIDFNVEEGFIQAARSADNPAQKQAILKAFSVTEEMLKKMQVGKGAKGIERYVPIAQGAANMMGAGATQQAIDASSLNQGSPQPQQPVQP